MPVPGPPNLAAVRVSWSAEASSGTRKVREGSEEKETAAAAAAAAAADSPAYNKVKYEGEEESKCQTISP